MDFQPVEKWGEFFHVDETEISKESLGSVMVTDLDLLYKLILIINCEENVVAYQDLIIPMTTLIQKLKDKKKLRPVLESTRDRESITSEQSRLVKLLGTDYKANYIEDILKKRYKMQIRSKTIPYVSC